MARPSTKQAYPQRSLGLMQCRCEAPLEVRFSSPFTYLGLNGPSIYQAISASPLGLMPYRCEAPLEVRFSRPLTDLGLNGPFIYQAISSEPPRAHAVLWSPRFSNSHRF